MPDQLGQLAVEERHQQRGDMGAVHVGVGHDDDPAVAQPGPVEPVAHAAAQRLDQVLQLLILQQLLVARAGDVEDLAAQRQHRLGVAVARLLGRAAGAVALDEEDLGVVAALARAVGELAGQAQPPCRGLARDVLALAPAQALLGALDDEGEQVVGLRRVAGEPVVEPVAQRAARRSRAASGLVSFSLVWPWNCGSRMKAESLAAIGPSRSSAGDLRGAPVAALLAPGAQPLEQGGPEPGLVRAALRRRHRVAVGVQHAVGASRARRPPTRPGRRRGRCCRPAAPPRRPRSRPRPASRRRRPRAGCRAGRRGSAARSRRGRRRPRTSAGSQDQRMRTPRNR